MNPKQTLITIILLLLILLGLTYMWPFKKTQPTSQSPKITEEQAKKIAVDYIKMKYNAVAPTAGGMTPDGRPYIVLKDGFWVVGVTDITARVLPSGKYSFTVEIDANTGKVLKDSPTLANFPFAAPKITQTKTFSCPGMEGFTFEYPVFEGWEPLGDWGERKGEYECSLYLKNNGQAFITKPTELDPRIVVTKVNLPEDESHLGTPKFFGLMTPASESNPQGVTYDLLGTGLKFYTDTFGVRIQLPNTSETFPKDLFFQTVIKSFKLTK